jgi:hypothetical protein
MRLDQDLPALIIVGPKLPHGMGTIREDQGKTIHRIHGNSQREIILVVSVLYQFMQAQVGDWGLIRSFGLV